jgi:bisphosphoglycerate-independent phosphoglycerate mutase (AlkP superfamily)
MAKKALLMILDGWGNGKHGKGDVIFNTADTLSRLSQRNQCSRTARTRVAKTLELPDDRWVTLRWDTSISVQDASYIKIW